MAKPLLPLTIGVEEELFLVDSNTGLATNHIPSSLFEQFNAVLPEQLVKEYLSPQVELVSKPCANISEISQEYHRLRGFLLKLAHEHQLAPVAASSHPISRWQDLEPNSSKRYQRLSDELNIAAKRMAVCGMHVHIGIENADLRLKVYNQLCWYLPYLLALSTSSPFWGGVETGHNSYRLSVIDGLPRSGLPQQFNRLSAYKQYIDSLVSAGAILDASEIWWDLRMSCRFPTIEVRIMDTCTQIEDGIAIAALYQCLVHYLIRDDAEHRDRSTLLKTLTRENRWRAQRFPLSSERGLVDIHSLNIEMYKASFEQIVERLMPDAKRLGCVDALTHVLTICERGTSADRQRDLYQTLRQQNSHEAALSAVVDDLIAQTAKGVVSQTP